MLARILHHSRADREPIVAALAALIKREACLAGANLRGATLADIADFDICSLAQADLRGAALFRTSLRGARLTGTKLHGAHLTIVDVRGVDLRQVEGLTRAHLPQLRRDPHTLLPSYLFSDDPPPPQIPSDFTHTVDPH